MRVPLTIVICGTAAGRPIRRSSGWSGRSAAAAPAVAPDLPLAARPRRWVMPAALASAGVLAAAAAVVLVVQGRGGGPAGGTTGGASIAGPCSERRRRRVTGAAPDRRGR